MSFMCCTTHRKATASEGGDSAAEYVMSVEDVDEASILRAPHVFVNDIFPQNIRHCSYFFCEADSLRFTSAPGDAQTSFGLAAERGSYKLSELPPNIAHVFDLLVRQTLSGKYMQMQVFYRRKNVLLNSYPIKDPGGRVVCAMLVARPTPFDRIIDHAQFVLSDSGEAEPSAVELYPPAPGPPPELGPPTFPPKLEPPTYALELGPPTYAQVAAPAQASAPPPEEVSEAARLSLIEV